MAPLGFTCLPSRFLSKLNSLLLRIIHTNMLGRDAPGLPENSLAIFILADKGCNPRLRPPEHRKLSLQVQHTRRPPRDSTYLVKENAEMQNAQGRRK